MIDDIDLEELYNRLPDKNIGWYVIRNKLPLWVRNKHHIKDPIIMDLCQEILNTLVEAGLLETDDQETFMPELTTWDKVKTTH